MNDPRRLIDGPDGTVAQLLTAGRLEEPSPELVARFARSAALGVAAVVVVEHAASTAVASATSAASGSAAAGTAAGSGVAAGAGVAALASGVATTGAGAGGVAAGAVAGGALAKGAAAGALLKGATSAVLAKWLGVGIVGLTAAVATPPVLHWAEQREADAPAVSDPGASMRAQEELPRAAAQRVAPVLEQRVQAREATRVAPAARVEPTPPPVASRASARPAATGTPTAPRAKPTPATLAAPRAAAPSSASAQSVAASSPSPSAAPSPLPPAVTSTGATPGGTHAPPRTLGAELARVDRARAALARGDALQTLRELHGYERAFPARQLELEVAMLRMEAHVQRSDLASARDLARRILAGGASPLHARRAREVLKGKVSPR